MRLLRWTITSIVAALVAAGCATGKTSDKAIIRVMTYNIHHGEGVDGNVDIDRIAKVIRDANADIVALQEVDRGV